MFYYKCTIINLEAEQDQHINGTLINRGTQREKHRKTLQMQFSTFSYRFMVF